MVFASSLTLTNSLNSGTSSVFCWMRAAPFSWQLQNRMYGCMCGSWAVSMSPIIFTGIFSPDIFLRTRKALNMKRAWVFYTQVDH